jgi:AcrR family transcriptional regulator
MAPHEPGGNPRRPYRSPARQDQARRTRAAILVAAHDAFVADGYAAASLRGIAQAAGVSVPTIEQTFGTKRNLLKTVVDVTRAGDDEPVPLLERAPARAASGAVTAEEFLALVTAEVGAVAARVSAIFSVVAHAVAGDEQIAALSAEIDAQRRTVAAWIVDAVRRRGRLRPDLGHEDAVDTVWVLLDPTVHRRLTADRAWTTGAFTRWLADALARLLLTPSPRGR